MSSAKTLLSFEEFEKLPQEDGAAHELAEGELIRMTPGRLRHNRVRDNIAFCLRQFLVSKTLGEVVIETEFQLSSDTVRIPDAAFVSAKHIKEVDPDRPLMVPPALVVEVVSPNDPAADLAKKVGQYLHAGASTVWVIYPNLREAHIFQPDVSPRIVRNKEPLSDEKLLPGFSLPLHTIFS